MPSIHHAFLNAYLSTQLQTETGGHVITPLPGCTPAKPGSACFPFFGVVLVTLDPETGKELEGDCEGRHVDVCIKITYYRDRLKSFS